MTVVPTKTANQYDTPASSAETCSEKTCLALKFQKFCGIFSLKKITFHEKEQKGEQLRI